MPLRLVSLDDLNIDDEKSFRHVGLYQDLKQVLRQSNHRFRIPAEGSTTSWDRVLFLNLTFWSGQDPSDVLTEASIPADVIAHVAWHHVISQRLSKEAPMGRPSAVALLFAESIASAFDLYLVGRLLNHASDSDFITSQVPIMGEVAEAAGLSEDDFTALLNEIARQPERAFEDLRSLLMDVVTALLPCPTADEAQLALECFRGHRFEPLLHHFQLSNWILYARAYAAPAPAADEVIRRFDAILRAAPDSLDWLTKNWVGQGA